VIAAVSGEVLVRRPDHVVVDAAGVGYRLNVSTETLRAVPAVGKKTSLHAHLVVRDDSMALYGFATEEERDLFLLLTSVSGVGPKVAVAALSGGSVRDLLTAIAGEDAKRFQAVPGIGKRTAERIILELRDKVADELTGETGDGVPTVVAGGDARAEAREGLLGLGYTPVEAERLLDGARASGAESAEDLLQAALRSGGSGAADRTAA
jgi:Holliday junction DNA helicase RuvA